MIVNVVDLGSNSFQWLVARCAQGRVERLHQQKRFARFASSVALTGRLSETDIERGVRMVADLYAEVAPEYRCETTLAVATGAIRQASNGLEFIERLRSELGLEARILRGDEEAELAFRGALSCIGAVNNERHAVLDLGGGSLELGVGTADGPDGVWSVQRGMLHYLEWFESAGRDGSALRQAGQEVRTAMAQEVGERQLSGYPTVVLACGVARDLTALLDTIAPHALRSGNKPWGVRGVIDSDSLRDLLPTLAALTPEALGALGVPDARCRILAIGATILHAVSEQLGATQLLVASGGLREGVACAYARERAALARHARVA